MKPVYIIADNIVSPLGATAAANFEALLAGRRGVQQQVQPALSETPFFASLFPPGEFNSNEYTKFELLLIASIGEALAQVPVAANSARTALILSSTKGNISLLETEEPGAAVTERVSLSHSAALVAARFGFSTRPIIISNACISGLLAMITGMRLIQAGTYDQVVVAGADVISRFVLSGFQSFQAVSAAPCRPFDAARDGINLGEGAATVILSAWQHNPAGCRISAGSVSNDANHISGPSRTGEELFQAISRCLAMAGLAPADIDFISAHGTATLYNDEMESKAIALANLLTVPLNSLKGYYGHTLGAAGLIETVISIRSLQAGKIIPTAGFEKPGVSQPVTVADTMIEKSMRHCLKTASGFGGCNAAVIVSQ
ncbi:MAG: beta-ketoacyl synthase N-terminal-like domain-containing protein [Ferruginibacter sp.]